MGEGPCVAFRGDRLVGFFFVLIPALFRAGGPDAVALAPLLGCSLKFSGVAIPENLRNRRCTGDSSASNEAVRLGPGASAKKLDNDVEMPRVAGVLLQHMHADPP